MSVHGNNFQCIYCDAVVSELPPDKSIIWVACKALCVDFLSSVSSFSSQKTHGELKEKNSFFVPNVLLFPSVFIKKTAILKITRAEWIVNGEFIDKYISR